MQKTKFEDDSVSANAHGGRLGGASEIAALARPGASAPSQHAARCEMRMVIFILTAAYYTISPSKLPREVPRKLPRGCCKHDKTGQT